MQIHVVSAGETLRSIADYYGVSVNKLIQDNGLNADNDLVTGQSIVIIYPELIYTVQEGDTLTGIADTFSVTVMQLYRNNPYLFEREFIYPGDTIVISYEKEGPITVHGHAAPFINTDVLVRTLPYLTYLSILNYTASAEGEIITYYDDTNIIRLAREYSVFPLMLLTTLTLQGKPNIGIAFDLLLNDAFQESQLENILYILRTKGYYGVNLSFQYITVTNIQLYESFLAKIATRLKEEGYFVCVTIDPNITVENDEVRFERVDYSILNQYADSIIFMNYEWAFNYNSPSPISSIRNTELFLNHVLQYIPPEKIVIEISTIGYDWELPYIPGISRVNSLSFDRVTDLALNSRAVIQFDEVSQTPYFYYEAENRIDHVVWFINSRSIRSSLELFSRYQLQGVAIWNLSVFNTQLWMIINSRYEIEKNTDSQPSGT